MFCPSPCRPPRQEALEECGGTTLPLCSRSPPPRQEALEECGGTTLPLCSNGDPILSDRSWIISTHGRGARETLKSIYPNSHYVQVELTCGPSSCTISFARGGHSNKHRILCDVTWLRQIFATVIGRAVWSHSHGQY